jgi:hypothetical protein
VCGQQNQCPTVLEALALKVPSDGPRVDHTAVSPWEVPNWVACTRYMGVVAPYVRKAWTRDLMASCEGMSIMITHTAAAVVSRHCGDLTVVGGAAATFSVGGSRPKVSAWSAMLRYCRNVHPTWVQFHSSDTKESVCRFEVLRSKRS